MADYPPITVAGNCSLCGRHLEEEFEPIARLSTDLRIAAKMLSKDQARLLVDFYYQMQRDRIRAAHQRRTQTEAAEPNLLITWLQEQTATLEGRVKSALDAYSANQPASAWARLVPGIGPVIAAGLLCHIDIAQAPTVGHIWSFAGLNPAAKWERGTKRPWNAALKRLCWLIGESFVKVSNRENDVYGAYYKARKELESARNEKLEYAEQATASLAAKRYGADTQARAHYEAGKLPPARIHLRAERYAVKLFLSDLHCVMHWLEYHALPPKPYVLEHVGGHVHQHDVPFADAVPGLAQALAIARHAPRK